MLLLSIEKCSDGLEASLHILTVLQLISAKEKANTRENDIFLEGYIKNYEDMCTTPNCPLKKYTYGDYSERKNLARNHLNTLIILLYQHIEVLFKNALNRFPSCVRLRLYYIEFLNVDDLTPSIFEEIKYKNNTYRLKFLDGCFSPYFTRLT
jgi:hypothetical protein